MPGQGEVRFDLDERKVRFGAEPTRGIRHIVG